MRKLLILALIFASCALFAQQKEKSVSELKADVAKLTSSIELTRNKIKSVKDVSFLPDLYFVLAELYVEKSRYTFQIERLKNPKEKIEDLDLTESRKAKKEAIETYIRITELFPKTDNVDRALFYLAHEYREMSNYDEMIKTYGRIQREFPKSPFWEESTLIIGNYFLDDKKDPTGASEQFQKILARPQNPFMPVARYKLGWCYINQQKFYDAMLAFEGVITIDSAVKLDTLPEMYKRTDVRRDALLALVWPYSEQKKLDSFRVNPVTYFEGLSPNRPTMIKVFEKLARRLEIKKRDDDAIPVYYRLLEISNDLERRVESIEKLHELLVTTKKQWPFDTLPRDIASTLIRARWSPRIPTNEKRKLEVNFEIYMRDITTKLQKRAKATQKEKDYLNAIQGYEDYLAVFPENKYTEAILTNLAESYFTLKKYARAGYYYERIVNRGNKNAKKDLLDSAIQSYALALKTPDKITKLELNESRDGFRTTGALFVKRFPNDKANAMILFNIGRTYYDERNFDKAISNFNRFINTYPNHKETTTAGNLILDAYNQRDDIDGLIKAGKGLIANQKLKNPQFKKDISEIVKQAEFKKLQKNVGDSKSRDYAKKLMGFASKYQGTDIGDQALYEAFIALKSKKDPQAYDPGEQLLAKHGDSKYAKEVVGAMGQMAVNTADYRRAANYFEIFARKYPKDPSSQGLMRSAAQLRELLGDTEEAAGNFRDLGLKDSVARQFANAQNWGKLASTIGTQARDLKSSYWVGLALYRQGQVDQAKPFFAQAARASASSPEEKRMAAHSLYLLASQALKDYQSIQLGGGNEAQLVKVKSDKLNQMTNQFNSVINYGDGRWTIAALYQLGQAHNEFAQFIMGASVPAGLNETQKAQYQQLISQQSAQYKGKAQTFFKTCVTNAEKFEVFTIFARGCQNPSGNPIDEASDGQIMIKAGDASPQEASAIRRKLFDSPKDTALLMDLAESYVKAGEYPYARVILSRVLEIKPNLSTAEARLGNVFLFMNDAEGASSAFKTALKHNPREALALWGLAGLYRQYGFTNKASRFASQARAAGRPSGTLHPWISGN